MISINQKTEQQIIRDNIRDLKCFHCGSSNVYWHYEFQRFECVDCGSYTDFPGKGYQCSVVKGCYMSGCVKVLGMIHSE